MKNIRKQLPNYSLPSERWESLKSIVGKRVGHIKIGNLHSSCDELLDAVDAASVEALASGLCGYPILMGFGEGKTYVFLADDFTQSLAFRIVGTNIDNPGIIGEIYREDSYIPRYLRMQSLLDLSGFGDYIGKQVSSVSVEKLPDNYFGAPVKGTSVNEVAIVMVFEDSSELLIAYGMGPRMAKEHCILRCDMISPSFPVESLKCILRYPE